MEHGIYIISAGYEALPKNILSKKKEKSIAQGRLRIEALTRIRITSSNPNGL